MKKIALIFSLFTAFAVVGNAQADRSRIIALMKQQEPDACNNVSVMVDAESVKVGPGKFGFIGSCSYGGGPRVLFLKVGSRFKKLLAIYIGMNGGFGMEKFITASFIVPNVEVAFGNEFEETIYRWNGTRYVAGRGRTM